MRRQPVGAAGTGVGGRQSRESPVARAARTVSLSRMSRAVRREPALLGAPWGAGVGVSALDLAGLEDASTGRVDRMERRAATAQPPTDREQWEISHPALGASQGTGEQDPGAERATNAARLGKSLWASSAAAGNPGGCGAFSRDLLSGCQLGPCRANHRTRPH